LRECCTLEDSLAAMTEKSGRGVRTLQCSVSLMRLDAFLKSPTGQANHGKPQLSHPTGITGSYPQSAPKHHEVTMKEYDSKIGPLLHGGLNCTICCTRIALDLSLE
jgi:hypothetical protein